jgi:carbon monoxide dehydrogenase subunit G
MKLTGENRIKAPPQEVWRALNDAEVLRQAIPGCESLEKISDTAFKATVATKIGPVQAKFNGQVQLSDLDPPNGYTISGSGSGGMAGNAKGGAKVRLEPDGDGTKLTYDVDAQVTGKLAQLGSRLIDSTAKMLAGQFFNRFEQIVGAQQAEATAPAAATGTGDAAHAPETHHADGHAHPAKSGPLDAVPAWLWAVIITGVVILAAYVFQR